MTGIAIAFFAGCLAGSLSVVMFLCAIAASARDAIDPEAVGVGGGADRVSHNGGNTDA